MLLGILVDIKDQPRLGFGTPCRDRLKGAALKLLQPAPPVSWPKEHVVAQPGWVPEEASSAQSLWILAAWASIGSPVSKSFRVLMPLPQCGPYEALEGIYPGRARKNWGDKV